MVSTPRSPLSTKNSTPAEDRKSVRMQVQMTPAELARLDDWRFSHRVGSRAAAIRLAIRRLLGG